MPILMTTVEAGGNVLLPYWSKIHYERLVDSWVNDGERSIHHKSMPTVLGTHFWLIFSFSPLWFSFSLLLINTKPVGIREQTFWLKSDSTSLYTLLLKGTLNRFFLFVIYLLSWQGHLSQQSAQDRKMGILMFFTLILTCWLSKSEWMKHVEWILLCSSVFQVTDQSVRAVAEHCPELQFVGFMGCPVTSQGVIHLTAVSMTAILYLHCHSLPWVLSEGPIFWAPAVCLLTVK